MVVSVAHVGGVDPEASLSTVEMKTHGQPEDKKIKDPGILAQIGR